MKTENPKGPTVSVVDAMPARKSETWGLWSRIAEQLKGITSGKAIKIGFSSKAEAIQARNGAYTSMLRYGLRVRIAVRDNDLYVSIREDGK